MPNLGNYDPKNIQIIFGPHEVKGYADGTFVTAENDEDSFGLANGADGDACRVKSNNNSGTVNITLLQSSASNAFLSAQAELDKATPNGDGIQPLLIRDGNGLTLVVADRAWIQKSANVEFSKEVTGREWPIRSHDLKIFNGGN